MPKKNSNTLKILTHILGLFAYFLGPLIVLLSSEEKDEKNHAKYALNWQISFIIYLIISFVLVIFSLYLGIFLFFVFYILHITFCIIAAVKASKDKLWRYPLAIPFFRKR